MITIQKMNNILIRTPFPYEFYLLMNLIIPISICFKKLSLTKFKPITPDEIILPFFLVKCVASLIILLESDAAEIIVQSAPSPFVKLVIFRLYYF